jgi:deoxyribodipyrimidine photo-lyase
VSDLRRDFEDRETLIAYLREHFPDAVGDDVSDLRGGRSAAEARLAAAETGERYTRARNHVDGAVSRLSAYLRHGVLSLREVRQAALDQAGDSDDPGKFINELAWRDYWQRVYAHIGEGVWDDREAYKTGYAADDYRPDLPEDIADGATGLRCMDAFSAELCTSGYLHNHQRMWLAAYVVHWRRVSWQAGARWFLQHLLDGDPASNNLSWQWVASTFSHKPYFFNRENLERFTGGRHCADCPLAARGCPFDASYETLESRLFAGKQTAARCSEDDRKGRR